MSLAEEIEKAEVPEDLELLAYFVTDVGVFGMEYETRKAKFGKNKTRTIENRKPKLEARSAKVENR